MASGCRLVVNRAVTRRAKILIVEIPSLLREIIEEMVADEDDMEVVGELPDHSAIVELVERTGATFVIAGLTHPELDALYRELLLEQPATRVLAVGREGRQSTLYELRPRIETLGELSPEMLLTVIRGGETVKPTEPFLERGSRR
jgi:DNA-binding NarL/FixJ family response regulator